MVRQSRLVLAGAAIVAAAVAIASALASVPLETGNYQGRTTVDAGGKPHSIALSLKKTGCAAGKAGYCLTVDPESFIQGKCAASGFMYNAFFPLTSPIAVPASGAIEQVYTLYVAHGEVQMAPGNGAVKSGKFELSLRFDPNGKLTGSERLSVDLHEGDGVCDTGLVKLNASR
jgi:hypothetical protein